jgi:hypothetical protein
VTEWTSSETDSLREATAAWVGEVCVAFASAPPLRDKTVLSGMSATGYSTRREPELDFIAIAIASRQLGDRAPAFDAIRNIAARHYSFFFPAPRVGPTSAEADGPAAGEWVSTRFAELVLVAYLRKVGSVHFDRARFDEVFDLVENDLRAPSIPFLAYAPLARLRLRDSAPIEVLPNVRIRGVTDADRERWLNETHVPWVDRVGLHEIQTVLEVRYGNPDGTWDPDASPEVQTEIRQICWALQLTLDCDVSPAYVQFRRDKVLSGGPRMGSTISSNRGIGHVIGELSDSDVERTRVVHHTLESSPNLGHCQIAIRRWDAVTAGPGHEDTIVDSWVGLESLLFSGGASGELSYRASLRLAVLIGRDAAERRRLFSEVRKAYDARSRVLHGANTGSLDLPRLAADARGYLRRALVAVLGLTSAFDPNSIEGELLGRDLGAN